MSHSERRSAAQSGSYLAAADFLRAASIFLIAWYHFWQQSWLNPNFSVAGRTVDMFRLVSSGYMMVDVLLVLSGFLLTLPYARARRDRRPLPSVRGFYARRFWRIVPSYLLAILAIFFLYALPNGKYASAGAALRDLLTHLSFTHNLSYWTCFATPMPTALWTLAVEVQFYLLFPLLMKAYVERPFAACAGLALAAFAARGWVLLRVEDTTMFVNQLPCLLDLYACGMLAATALAAAEERKPGRALSVLLPLLGLLCFLLLLQLVWIQPYGDHAAARRMQLLWRFPVGLLASGALLCGCLMPAALQRALGNPLTRLLAAVSYNYYIWHGYLAVRLKDWHIPPYVSEFPQREGEMPWQRNYVLLCFVGVFVLAAVLTYGFEKPLSRFGRRLSEKKRTQKASA